MFLTAAQRAPGVEHKTSISKRKVLALVGGWGLTRPEGVPLPCSTTCRGRDAPWGATEASLVTEPLEDIRFLFSEPPGGEASVCRAS